jgi:translation initiation factor 2A
MEQVVSKSFFRATEANFSWNSSGTAVLVQTHTDVDKSGKSYYGESGLYCLSTDKTLETDVRLSKC